MLNSFRILFISFYVFIFPYFTRPQCIAIDSNENTQCSYCSSQYYVDDKALFATQNLFNITTCVQKTNSTYKKDLYIYPSSTCGATCDGTLAKPYPNLYDAMIDSSFEASKYNRSELNFYLLGNNHYITRDKVAAGGGHMFKKMHATITIQPHICSSTPEPGCFQSTDVGPTIYIKSDEFKFYISSSMKIKQVVFDGSDGHLTATTDTSNCGNSNQVCCTTSKILDPTQDTSSLKCGISNVVLPARDNMQKNLGLFNILYEFDDNSTSTIPYLMVNKCKFLNFYSFKDEIVGQLYTGSSAFFQFYYNLPGMLEVVDTTIQGGYYRFGIMQRTNKDSLAHNLINSNESSKIDLNETLKGKSIINMVNFSVIDYNLPKIVNQDIDNFGSLIYISSIKVAVVFNSCVINNVGKLAGGAIYVDPGVTYESSSMTAFQNIQIFNVTGNFLMWMSYCINYIFLDNVFKYNDMTTGYGFVIKNNPLFYFQKSIVEGPKLSKNEYFSIESSKFLISYCNFTNMQTDLAPYFFIKTTTKIYVASDTQFASSQASESPWSSDEITIEYTNINNCNFLIFNNEHSVLYFTIQHSYFKDMNMNTTNTAISITCERHVLFDNLTVENLTHREHFVTLFAGRNFTVRNCRILNGNLINFILLMVVIPLNYDLRPYVYCRLSNNTFSNIKIIKNIQNSSLTEIVQFIESQPISRGFGFHYIIIENNTFEEILDTTLGADYLLYFAGGHANMTDNYFANIKMMEIARFFPRIPNSILCIFRNKFKMVKYYIQHFFIITIGYYVDQLFIEDSMFEAKLSLNYSSGLEFLNIGTFSIKRSILQHIQSLTGNALTVNTNSLKAFYVDSCYFYFNAGANNNGADIVLGVANLKNIVWSEVDLNKMTYGIFNSTFDSAQASGSLTLMDNGEMLIYNSTFKHIIGDSGAVLNIGSSCRIFVSNIIIYNISANDNGGCFKMMTTEFYFQYSVIEMAGSSQIGGVIIATESSTVDVKYIYANNTFSLKGGVISTEDSNLTILNSSFGFSNSSSQGGHFYLKKSIVIFTNVNLTNGVSLTAGSIYGELVTLDFENVRVVDCECDLAKGLGTIHLIGSDLPSLLHNLLCQNNKAMTGTCIFAKDIEIKIIDCWFLNNFAAVHSIIEIFFSSLKTKLDIQNSLFQDNIATSCIIKSKITTVNITYTLFENNTVGESVFLLDQVDLYLNKIDFKSKYGPLTDVYIIYLTNSEYAYITKTFFYGANSLGGIYCMSCLQLNLYNITIQDSIGTYGAGIRARSSFVDLRHILLFNNSASQGGGGIYLEDSWINVTDTIFKKNSISSSKSGLGSDIYCNNAQIYKYKKLLLFLTESNTSQITGYSFYITYSNIELSNFIFYGQSDLEASAIQTQDCINVNIRNTLFNMLKNLSALVLNNNYRDVTYLNISNTNFSNCSTQEDGAFLRITGNINVWVGKTIFFGGVAENRGGAVYFENSANFSKSCFNFTYVDFLSNTAKVNGGAIFTAYTLMGEGKNVSFVNNKAKNGQNLYSYPSKLLIIANTGEELTGLEEYVKNNTFIKDYLGNKLETELTFNTKSGVPFSFGILIIDDYNNVLDSETDTICEIKPRTVNGSTSVEVENNIAKLTEGMAIFTRVSIVEKSDTLYYFTVIYSGNNDYQQLSRTFNIFVEKCGRGEIFNENRCLPCEENFYSLEPDPEKRSIELNNKTMECSTCPVMSECPGGDKIIPYDGYWRMNENTTKMVKCYPKESCPYQAQWVTQTTHTAIFQCKEGYSENLCQMCAEGWGQYHTGCYSCYRQDNYHYALYFFKFLFMILLIVYETYGALKKEHSVSKCLIRIYLNHTIYLIAFTGLNLSLDDEFRKLFGQVNSNLSIIPSDIFNFHCLLDSSTKHDKIFSANLAIQIILPVLYGSICFFLKTCFDVFLYCCSPRKFKRPAFKRLRYNLIITFYLAYRNWYPRVLMSTMDLFKCVDLGNPNYEYLQFDPNIPCWQDEHNKILIGTILPSIIIWVILVPGVTFYYLRKNKHLLAKRDAYIQENETRRQQSTVRKFESVKENKNMPAPQGTISDRGGPGASTGEKIKKGESIFFYWTIDYQKKYYTWVVIENVIAFSILLISQLIAGLEDKIQRMIMFICFAILFLMYQKLEPFQQKINNTIASFSLTMALFTIIFQMIGANETNNPNIMDFSVGMIIFCNIFFYFGGLIVVILYRHKETRRKIYAVFKGILRYILGFCRR